MTLRADRHIPHDGWETRFICPVVASGGDILVYHTAGSGAGLMDGRPKCTLVANPSGYKPIGMLMTDVSNIDQTRYHLNWFKTEQAVNDPVPLAKKGYVTINGIHGTPSVGGVAYLGSSGHITTTASTAGGLAANPKIGQFETELDEDGYCSVRLEIPNLER